jgi:hypothetical protein
VLRAFPGYPADLMPHEASIGVLKTVLQSFKSNVARLGYQPAVDHVRSAAAKRAK